MQHVQTCPRRRTDVLNDPENLKAVFPVGNVLARQGTFNLNRYPAPYDWTPPFNDAITRMIKGEVTAGPGPRTVGEGRPGHHHQVPLNG